MEEIEPCMDNLVYIDEYPELKKRIWLRRLEQERQLGETVLTLIIPFPRTPDDAA